MPIQVLLTNISLKILCSNSIQPYWSPSYPTTSPTAPLLLPSYAAGPYTEYTSVHPADITPLPSTYLLPVTDYQVDLVQRQQCNMHIWVRFPRTGKMSNMWHFFLFLTLYCDQTVGFFQVFSTVLKRLCPLDPKNTFVLVLAIFLDF